MTEPTQRPVVVVGPGRARALALLQSPDGGSVEVELRGGHPDRIALHGDTWMIAQTMTSTDHGLAYRYVPSGDR